MEWSEHIKTLQRAKDQGHATALDSRPTLYGEWDFYLDAYKELIGGDIPIGDIVSYAELNGVVFIREFVSKVKAIDTTMVRIRKEKQDGD